MTLMHHLAKTPQGPVRSWGAFAQITSRRMFAPRPLSVLNLAANPHCATHRDRLEVPKHSCTHAAGGFAPNWR
jgi:hypothetical protein